MFADWNIFTIRKRSINNDQNCITVRPSDVLSKYHGESERYLRGVFERARTLPRAVIFFDGKPMICL
jgi:SpoVK/Ycf46/Vps4 family AAA+-type ATPase